MREGDINMTGMVSTIMIFSIPIIAIVTSHLRAQTKIKHKMLKDELALEKLKHENFAMETQKMKYELELMKLEAPNKNSDIV